MYAQDADYWDTQVSWRRSLAEIDERLMELCGKTAKEVTEEDGLPVITLYWSLDGVNYQARFRCLKLDWTRVTGRVSQDKLRERQANQMGRIAWWWMKSALLMHEYGNKEVLLPYAMLPARTPDGKPATTTLQQQGVDWLLAGASGMKALPSNSELSEVKS